MGFLPLTAHQLFPACNLILPSWFCIGWNAKAPLTKKVNLVTTLTLAGIYASIIIPMLVSPDPNAPPMDFFTLDGIVTMFQKGNAEGILAGWVHYCVTDLMTGWYIARDYEETVEFSYATKAFEVFALFSTCMFGPMGLATYLVGKYAFLPPKTVADSTKTE